MKFNEDSTFWLLFWLLVVLGCNFNNYLNPQCSKLSVKSQTKKLITGD